MRWCKISRNSFWNPTLCLPSIFKGRQISPCASERNLESNHNTIGSQIWSAQGFIQVASRRLLGACWSSLAIEKTAGPRGCRMVGHVRHTCPECQLDSKLTINCAGELVGDQGRAFLPWEPILHRDGIGWCLPQKVILLEYKNLKVYVQWNFSMLSSSGLFKTSCKSQANWSKPRLLFEDHPLSIMTLHQ